MPIKLGNLEFNDTLWCDVELEVDRYESGNGLALRLTSTDDEQREDLTTVTVNVPTNPPSDGCVWVKDDVENTGVLHALQEIGVLTATGRTLQVGMSLVHEAIVASRVTQAAPPA